MIPYGGHEDSVVGFTENTPIVFEEGSKIKIDKGCSSVQFRFENLNKQKYIFDSTEWFGLHLSINYILDGAFGVKGIIKMYLNIEVFLIDRNSKFSFSFFKINTILWNNNKFIDNTCCSEDSNCQTSCPHNFLFSLGGKIFSESEAFIKRNKLKTAYYDYYCLFEHKDLTIKKKMDIIFSIVSNMESKQFDKILIKNFSFPPNYISSKINIGGMYGNLVTNLIMGNSCNGYTSDNCVNICYAIKYIEKCDYKTGNIKCINGAKDLKTCEKHKLKCEDDACNGNGICMINKNRITCKCKNGYHGKYCEKWYCNKNCNNNGICEGPYTCHCYPFYHGKHCDMYLVDKNIDPDINKKLCYHHNNSIKCFCSKDLTTRKYCIKILCIQLNIPQHNENLLEILDFSCDCTKVFKDIKIQCYYTFIPFNQLILKNLYKKISFLISVISIILFVAIMIKQYRK